MYAPVNRQRLNMLEPNLEAFAEDIDPTDIVHLETNHGARKKRQGEKSHIFKDIVISDSAAFENVPPNQEVCVVPSGQVYRQLFDAGAQLRKAYDATRGNLADNGFEVHVTSTSNGLATFADTPIGIPLVRVARNPLTEGTGILSVRQQNWLATLPFEANVENPTAMRHTSDSQTTSDLEENDDSPTREVQNLPDVVEHHKKGSNIISRISKSRRERHERACDEMHQLLVLIATEFEPKIETIGSDLISKLSENDRQLEVALARLEPEAGLYEYSFSEMQHIWQDIEATASFRKDWIEEADSILHRTEDDRIARIADVMRQQTVTLEKISHLPKLDLEKYMDELSQLLNQIILSNRRAYVNLQLRIRTANIEQEKRMHDFYIMRLNEWKKFQVTRSIDLFRTFMMTEIIAQPPDVNRHISELTQELEQINRKRMDLLDSLTGFKPPSSTKRYIYQWNDKINVLTAKLGTLADSRMEKVFVAYEAASQKCAQKATDIRRSLIEACVMTEKEADELVNTHLIPIIGERQRMYEEKMETINDEIEHQSDQINRELKLLFTFCQGAAHLWDVHEISLAQTERALQERLHIARRDHDAENQDRENHLDIVMDRMRQDAGEQNLQKNLRRVKEQLEQIKEMYKKFHSDQLELVQSYPYMVKEAIMDYDTAVKRYFSLDVNPPINQAGETGQNNVADTSTMQHPFESRESVDSGGNRGSTEQQRLPDKTDDMVVPPPLLGNTGDVIRSDNGKCFYVVPSSHASGRRSTSTSRNLVAASFKEEIAPDTQPAFLTETEIPTDPLAGKQYLSSFYIGSDYFERIKKCIRLSFVNHLENWSESAMQRAHSIVAAKCEELHSELELRLHLHAPRVKRAEVDVHNVRAAELVLHNERIQRHCKGIAQSLAELKNRFEGLTSEHQKMFEKFQKEADGMDSQIIEATKSAKLAEMQTRLQRCKDKFLDGVRQSLRNFRHTLDSELQMLRESNANFIKSFRLFSDGGNFCPEEIDGFRKRLDKCSHKIDDSEGAIMSELEGVESKWLHKAAHLYNDFEDRFRHHMTDLVFMEKVARWLTNTQVKIKVEVAESNGQAQRLAHLTSDLERRLSACEEPHPDKEVVSSSDLYTSLKPLFSAFHGRCTYLDCALKDPLASSTSSEEAKDSKAGTKGVGFTDSVNLSGIPTIQTTTKAGSKVANEDPTISAIKNIYRMQKPPTTAVAAAAGAATGQGITGDSQLAASVQAAAENADTANSGKPNSDEVGAIRHSADKQQLQQSSDRGSQQHQHLKGSRQGNRSRNTPMATSATEPTAVASNNRHSSAVRRVNRFDRREKRFQLFPDESVSEDSAVEARNTTFLGKIKYILHEAQDGLFEAAELYYRQKGVRPVTRPQALQETMEQCAEIITEKLRSYYSQCDTYHNECLQEFRMQLTNIESLAARVPPLVLSDLTRAALSQINRTTDELLRSFAEQESKLEQRKSEHKTLLRPTLGHPNLADKMSALCQNEEIRTKETVAAFDQLEKSLREVSEKHASEFVAKLAEKSATIMSDFDLMLTVDDTVKGKLIPKKYPTTELLRRNQVGLPLDDVIPDTLMQRGKRSWDGLVKNELLAFGRPAKKLTTPALVTTKTTMGHHACQEAKLKHYQEYKLHFESLLNQIAERKAEQVRSEERWYSSWQVAVSKIRTLYRE